MMHRVASVSQRWPGSHHTMPPGIVQDKKRFAAAGACMPVCRWWGSPFSSLRGKKKTIKEKQKEKKLRRKIKK